MKKKQNKRFTKKVMSIAALWLWILLLFTLTGCAAVSADISVDRSVLYETEDAEVTDTDTVDDTDIQGSVADDGDVPDERMQVHFIDVGQADATLITCGDNAMLIDAGDDASGTALWNYIRKQGVTKLNYLILTHPHADHIGGADVILTKFDVDTVIMPELTADTAVYRALEQALADNDVPDSMPEVGTDYTLGEADFTIIAPNGDTYEDDANNASVGVLLRHGENKFLFTGDAEETAERDIIRNGIDISCDVYKAGHHGSRTASSEDFVEAAAPEYAVISCGEDNDYGHPHAEVLNRFRAEKIQVYRTDEQGSIVAVSDGSEITWNCAPTESWIAGEPKNSSAGQNADKGSTEWTYEEEVQEESEEDTLEEYQWILNLNTHKIHTLTCDSAAKIKPENIGYSSESIAELEAQGYAPCGNCKPTD